MKDILKQTAAGFTLVVMAILVGCGGSNVDSTHGNHDHSDHEHSEMAAMDSEPADSANSVSKPYPLDKCVVSGEALGSMGEPTVLTHNGQVVKLCCSDCVDGFNKEPEKYLAMLKEGVAGSHNTQETSSGHQH